MGKLIQFPTGEELKQKQTRTIIEDIVDESIGLAQHLLDVLDDEVNSVDVNWLEGFNMRDEMYPESRDAFVIVNMIYAMFLRYSEIPHELHKDLDVLYVNIKRLSDATTRNEIHFEPEVDLDGDDDDIT